MKKGRVIWFTGLSAAGKSTLSAALFDGLSELGYEVTNLDSDVIRREISKDLGFSGEDRDAHVRRLGFLAATLAREGAIVLVSAMSPRRQTRDEVRAQCSQFTEVYVNAPLEVCEQRDPKGLYKQARAGQVHDFVGVDLVYEPPLSPEVECRTDLETVEESLQKLLAYCSAEPQPSGTGQTRAAP
jgi:adenylylsulfate kinase